MGDVVQLEQGGDTPGVWRGRAGREQWCPKPWSPGLLPSWAVENCWWAGSGLGTVCPGHLHQWRVSSGHMGAPGQCPAKASESPGAAGSLLTTLYYPASPPSLRSLGDALSYPTVVDSDSVILVSRCSTRVSRWVCTCCRPLDLQKKIQIKQKPPTKPGRECRSERSHGAMRSPQPRRIIPWCRPPLVLVPGTWPSRGGMAWSESDPRAVQVPTGDGAGWVPASVAGFHVSENIELLCARCHELLRLTKSNLFCSISCLSKVAGSVGRFVVQCSPPVMTEYLYIFV